MQWFGRHKILTTILGVFALLIFLGALTPEEEPTSTSTEAEPQDPITVTVTETATPAAEPEATENESPTEQPSPTASATDDQVQAKPKHDRKPRARRYAVLDVVDGDTVEVAYRGGESVRVIGIDTPETVHPNVPEECWGQAASSAAERLLSGKRVSLVFDPRQGRRDSFGRLLAYIEAPGVGDFGLQMIRRGHAAEYTYDTAYRRQARYLRAESRAQAANRALWGTCGGPDVPKEKPAPEPGKRSGGGNCAEGYDPCVPPYPPDVDCADVDGPIRVTGEDPHGLDGEGDGIACE